jgi:ribosomal subunit interface protein
MNNMTLRITGKQIDIGDALRSQVVERIERGLTKYFDGGYSGQVVVEKEKSQFRTECRIHLDSGIDLQAEGAAGDAYQSLEAAAERLEKRLRRYKRRLKDHHVHARSAGDPVMASSIVLAPSDEDDDPDDAAIADIPGVDDHPLIVAESTTPIRVMTVGMAVMALDLATAPVMVFRNAAHGRINVIYRRDDGNVGWIDPPAMAEEARSEKAMSDNGA